MQGLYRPNKLKYLNLIIFAILSYLTQCAFAQKLVFFDQFLKEYRCVQILNASWIIILILTGLYALFFIMIERREKEYIAQIVYNNICQEVFNRFVKPLGEIKQHMKVSLIKAFEPESEEPYLKVVGRYQTKSPKKKSRVKFAVNEGCAGLAYGVGNIIAKSIGEYDKNKSGKYYDESEKTFNLPRAKAKKLNDYASQFLCIPVKYFRKEDVRWGILSIDSMEHCDFLEKEENARKIEDLLSCFSVFFVL